MASSPGAERGSAGGDGQELLPNKVVQVLIIDEDDALVTIRVREKEEQFCKRSLFILPMENWFRQQVLLFVDWKWFDRFILFCIIINSVLLGLYRQRSEPGDEDEWINIFIDNVADKILLAIFTVECIAKILAWGFVFDKKSYLRDPWNCLDFVVVFTWMLEECGAGRSFSFLRLFRVLRPMRSLNAIKEMRVLVNTALKSMLKLGNVVILGGFLFMVFGIIGISLMEGVFYRQCYETENPVLRHNGCWEWNVTGQGRLCGGNYMCGPDEGLGYCGGHEFDSDEAIAPQFVGGKGGHAWCDGSEPFKPNPETDFVHFDNILSALLFIFQVMTLEGWTELMYYVEDSVNWLFAFVYFMSIVVFTNFFMLNVALAVVDEVSDEFREEADAEKKAEQKEAAELAALAHLDEEESTTDDKMNEVPLWYDCAVTRFCKEVAESPAFANFIMLIIFGNVVNTCLQWFVLEARFGIVARMTVIGYFEVICLAIFIVEMGIMIAAVGPNGYILNPTTCFDGFVVIISVVDSVLDRTGDGGGAGFSALRTFRIFRVMNKLAKKFPKMNVLLMAMVATGKALNSWLILFVIVLYIFTLMFISFFARQFHFQDPVDNFAATSNVGKAWCPNTEGLHIALRQDCIPRAHFDDFWWASITVFQVMTGENWNTIMYASMRSGSRYDPSGRPNPAIAALLFVVLILFGQILFLSLFLSMLISKFGEVAGQIETAEKEKLKLMQSSTISIVSSILRKIGQGQMSREPESLALEALTKSRPNMASPTRKGSADLPGQMPDKECVPDRDKLLEPTSLGAATEQTEDTSNHLDGDEHLACHDAKEILEMKPWPHGYAFFIFNEANPIRMGARFIMEKEVQAGDTKINVFDNFILFCIIISTICMMTDSNLSDPADVVIRITRTVDTVFAITFVIEMFVKLIGLGAFFGGRDVYFKSSWNWLDFLVVCVTMIGMILQGGGPDIRVLRILRAFRPLRVISRNEGLRVVVQTIFNSLFDLFGLCIVTLSFLLIFALIFLYSLQGVMYRCTAPGEAHEQTIAFLGPIRSNLGEGWTTPLCLGSSILDNSVPNGIYLAHDPTVEFTGKWPNRTWTETGCPAGRQEWRRASADTPICLARCDPQLESHPDIKHLCHRKYREVEELPSMCDALDFSDQYVTQAQVGEQYVSDMQRKLVVPCGGFTVENGTVVETASDVSCKANFCPKELTHASDECISECDNHPDFCRDAKKSGGAVFDACKRECESACMCDDFCTPLILDAALCEEQHGEWGQSSRQNFDNIMSAALTLFEISTTEGWVNVMYIAADSRAKYVQPLRDSSMGFYIVLFPLWIVLSYMFLINLAVGIVCETFGRLREEGNQYMLTRSQRKWIQSRRSLHGRALFYSLTDLHLVPPIQRTVYDVISIKQFEQTIMTCIVVNTIFMALTSFPDRTTWWGTTKTIIWYFFTFTYTVECVLKMFALRKNYWLDPWNCFDFFCVVATLSGSMMNEVFRYDVREATQVIRILRIARLFRLLKFLKELNRLFMCLLISIPKLINVTLVLLLFLIIFSIVGMNLFGDAKLAGTLDAHGNFQDFSRSFLTLFRGATGEAWTEIMHDLMMTEIDWFRAGDWCVPKSLYDSRREEVYAVLKDKCLIDTPGGKYSPNACAGDSGAVVWIYWVVYTLLITFVILNILVAVILEGYDEGKDSCEGDNIEECIQCWTRYDPNHTLEIPLQRALDFINEVIHKLKEKEGNAEDTFPFMPLKGDSILEVSRTLPMKHARVFDMNVTPNNTVTFLSAARQVLRFTVLQDVTDAALKEIDTCDQNLSNKEAIQMKRLEVTMRGAGMGQDLASNMAAIRLQARFRNQKAQRKAANHEPPGVRVGPRSAGSGGATATSGLGGGALRSAAEAEAIVERVDLSLSPPPAG